MISFDNIGILIPLTMMLIVIIAIAYNIRKLNKIPTVNIQGDIDSKGKNIYDPETETGKILILEQKIVLKVFAYIFGLIVSIGMLIQFTQLSFFSSPVKTVKLIKEINNHGELLYVNKTIYELGLALWIIGFIGMGMVIFLIGRVNKKQ